MAELLTFPAQQVQEDGEDVLCCVQCDNAEYHVTQHGLKCAYCGKLEEEIIIFMGADNDG